MDIPPRSARRLAEVVETNLDHHMYGREEAVGDLVPAMIAAFLESDRAFVQARKTGGG